MSYGNRPYGTYRVKVEAEVVVNYDSWGETVSRTTVWRARAKPYDRCADEVEATGATFEEAVQRLNEELAR